MKRWYVAHTQVHAEERARGHLARQGFEVWLPQARKRLHHARRVTTVVRPLFPRYLFVRLDLAAGPWRAALSTVGVSHLVGRREHPDPVPEAVMAELKARAAPDGLIMLKPALGLRRGDAVRLAEGPLKDVEAIFQAATDTDRVVLLLKLLGRELAVAVPAATLERL